MFQMKNTSWVYFGASEAFEIVEDDLGINEVVVLPLISQVQEAMATLSTFSRTTTKQSC